MVAALPHCLRPWRVLLLVTWLSGVALFGPRAASAQTEPPGYRELVQEAVDEFGAQNFEEARALFARAHTLWPSARTHRGLGMVAFELRNYKESVAQLEAALSSKVKALDAERRSQTERLLARANGFVGRLVLRVEPSTASVLVDGEPLAADASPLVLNIGAHIVDVRAPGFVATQQTISIEGSDQKAVRINLVATPPASGPLLAAPSGGGNNNVPDTVPSAPKRPWFKSPWLWTTVGVVVVGAAAATGYMLLRPEQNTAPVYGGTSSAVIEAP